ncbi:SDR family oxidoreductase [uncultured Thiocystis sp.]|jgi:NAD(P)-dependent dehydrogenase (short-subunit alcohol dehydrogenase family)|uniref:SDR family NAD(P)-dependent oxidoreductase n=1 Tax=uncultured Thiocystis sp. TaxID=1202134 RepID=UPI0025EB2ED7|nr:SDR family oxidoreductase [uncultured Thiocystis sp.]
MSSFLIVGASSGIGQVLAQRLAQTHAVWTASRQPASPSTARHVVWDAATEPFPAKTLPDDLDGLVYCPGSIRLSPFQRLTDEAFRDDFELNLLGAVRVIRAALPALKAAPASSIVLFSTVAVGVGMPMHASVAAAKGAVEGLTRALAAELAPGIRVNAIAPSLTDTPLASGLLKTDRQREAAAERHPLGRVGQAGELAAAAMYLLSTEASWMTGQILRLDGGMSHVRRFG